PLPTHLDHHIDFDLPLPDPLPGAVHCLPTPQSPQSVLDGFQGVLHPQEAIDFLLGDEQGAHRIAVYPDHGYLMSLGGLERLRAVGSGGLVTDANAGESVRSSNRFTKTAVPSRSSSRRVSNGVPAPPTPSRKSRQRIL